MNNNEVILVTSSASFQNLGKYSTINWQHWNTQSTEKNTTQGALHSSTLYLSDLIGKGGKPGCAPLNSIVLNNSNKRHLCDNNNY